MKMFVRAALALASVAMVAPSIAEAQGKPVVAVLYYDNASLGKDRADYDGVGKGIAEMLITDMASNPNITVVERERVQALLTEQNLTKSGAIDPTTAIRLGKLIGAQYMITGTFISDGKGRFVVTSRVVNVQTSQITNPVRIDDRGDDVLGLIAKLSTKLNTELKLPALRVGDAGSMGAVPAGQPAYVAPTAASVAEVSKPAAIDVSKDKPVTQVAQAKSSRKMDMKTAMLYSKALEEEDAGNKSKAIDLYRQVDVKFPEYAPVQRKIMQLSQG